MAYGNPTQHQNYQNFPKIDTPIADPITGTINEAWLRLLMTLWTKVGGSSSQLPYVQYVTVETDVNNNPTGQYNIMSPQSGQSGGTIVTAGSVSADQMVLEVLSLLPPPTQISTTVIETVDPLAAVYTMTPADQGQPQMIPVVPADQLRINPIVNLALELGL